MLLVNIIKRFPLFYKPLFSVPFAFTENFPVSADWTDSTLPTTIHRLFLLPIKSALVIMTDKFIMTHRA